MLKSLYKFPLLVNYRLLLLLELKHIVAQLRRWVAVVNLRELKTSSLLETPNLSLGSLVLQGWINVSPLLRRLSRLRCHDPFGEPHSA